MKFILVIIFLFSSYTVQCKDIDLHIVTEDWPPFIINKSEVSGVVTNKVKEILKYTDIEYVIDVYPWARSFHIATTTPNTLIYSIYRTKQREKQFHWFCPIHQSTSVHAYKLASNDINIDSIKYLRTAVVGVMRGDNSHSYFLQHGFKDGVNLDVSSNEEINLKKLVMGRVDAVVQSKESLDYRLESLGVKNVKLVSGLVIAENKNAEHCMALSLGTKPEIINKISKGFKLWQQAQKE